MLECSQFQLVPGYRGFTIDSIKKLSYLDDISVSADERHQYRGLSRRREYILDEAKITFSVQVLKGVLMPEEIKVIYYLSYSGMC